MKTKHYFLIGTLGVVLGGAIFVGCKKDSTTTPTTTATTTADDDYTSAADETTATYAMNDAENTAEGAAQGTSNERVEGSPCAVLSGRDTTVGGVLDTLVEINFGPTDCPCLDGVYRRGIIFFYWTKGTKFYKSGTEVTMTFQDYFVKDIGIAGYRTLTNTTDTTAGSLGGRSFMVNANLTLTYQGGKTATWIASRTHKLVDTAGGYYYRITGSASGTSKSGKPYSLVITNALYRTVVGLRKGGCPYTEQGLVTVTRTGNANSLTVNYGTIGTCDNKAVATITIDGVSSSYNIML